SIVTFRLDRHAARRALHSFPTRRSSDLKSDGSHGIARRSRGVLKRLAWGTEDPKRSRFQLGIEKPSRCGIIEALDHLIGDLPGRSEEHTSELQSRVDLVCRLLLEKKNKR